MTKRLYDVIIVGAGLGGLAVGALLAAKEDKRVLVIEKEEEIGGRGISIQGGEITQDRFQKLLYATSRTEIVQSEPHLSEIFKRHLLEDYVLEAGIHVHVNSDQGRLFYILRELGIGVNLAWNEEAHYFFNGQFHKISKGGFPWMNENDFADLKKVNREMVKCSLADSEEEDQTPLKTWLKERTSNPKVLDFHSVAGTLCTSVNDPALISAGEVVRMNRTTTRAGCNIAYKSGALVDDPGGSLTVARKLAKMIHQKGGEIWTGTPVKQVLVDGGRSRGILIIRNGGEEEIEGKKTILNVSIRDIFSLISENFFPDAWVRKVKGLWAAGGVGGYMGLKRPIFNSKTVYFTPALFGVEDDFKSEVRTILWPLSAWAISLAPKGKQLVYFLTFLTEQEITDKALVEKVAHSSLDFHFLHHPNLKENLEWMIVNKTDRISPVAQIVGQVGKAKEISSDCPWIKDLYFVGEPIGSWGGVTDAAAESALSCITNITGKNYFSILPGFYLQ